MYNLILQRAGLERKQAKVYMACLELGPANAPDIAKKAEIKRTTAYGILDELMQKGLISYISKGKRNLFKAQDPSVLVSTLEANKKALENILPNLQDIYATYYLRPNVQFFEGKDGIKRIYEDTLRCQSKKIYMIARVKDFLEFPGEAFVRSYVKKRAKNDIVSYAIHPKSGDVYNDMFGEESSKWKRHVRYLPSNMFHASIIMIYDNKVAMISTKKENFGFIIESKEFAGAQQVFFDFLWKLGSTDSENY